MKKYGSAAAWVLFLKNSSLMLNFCEQTSALNDLKDKFGEIRLVILTTIFSSALLCCCPDVLKAKVAAIEEEGQRLEAENGQLKTSMNSMKADFEDAKKKVGAIFACRPVTGTNCSLHHLVYR